MLLRAQRGYGCSEIQYGQALKRHPRESMIVQTKVSRRTAFS